MSLIGITMVRFMSLSWFVILATPVWPEAPLTVTFDRGVLFAGPEGPGVLLQPAVHHITAGPSNRLVLTTTTESESWILQGIPIHHDVPLDHPQVLIILEEHDEADLHLLVLLPDGTGLDASGSVSGVQTRGGALGAPTPFSAKQRYAGVVMQQGRVQTDADYKEPGGSSSSTGGGGQSPAKHYGRVTLEQGRVQLDSDARRTVLQGCKVCALGH